MVPPMPSIAYLITNSRNKYGDIVVSGSNSIKCRWRDITDLSFENKETTDADAMAWFEADSGVERGSIVNFEGVHYRVERIFKARKLRDDTIQFIKCEMKKYGRIS